MPRPVFSAACDPGDAALEASRALTEENRTKTCSRRRPFEPRVLAIRSSNENVEAHAGSGAAICGPASGILTRSRESNERATRWFHEWRKPIRNWLRDRASVPAADADDLAQEVFLRLLRYSDGVPVENPGGYLFRIAANVANEWRERSRVRMPHDAKWIDALQADPEFGPENVVASNRLTRSVQSAVGRLPPRQREILLSHVDDGLTYKQVAQQRGLTYRIVLRDLTRAYGQLRMELRSVSYDLMR